MEESKKELRKRIRGLSKAFSSDTEAVRKASEGIFSHLEELPEFQSARTILAYCALPDEPQTADFLQRWEGIKRLAVPLVVGERLILKEYSPFHLHKGYCGILEPEASAEQVSPEEIEFAIIPGVAFSADGSRLGRGKGFYDRLLPSLNCPLVGVCFDFQMVEKIPSDPWDRKVDLVVSF